MNDRFDHVSSSAASAGVSWERAAIEKLLRENLRERRAARRWRIFRSLLWMLFFGLLVLALLVPRWGDSLPRPGPHTAVIKIEGLIATGADVSASSVLPALQEAMKEPNARALMLLINSPGGSPVQAGIINDELQRLRKLYDKPIYAVAEDSCASAAYYIAAAADDIFVDKASLVGSIGVLMDGFGFVDTMNKLGVERRLLTAGDNKGILDPFSPLDEGQKAFAQAMLDDVHQQFIAAVKAGRGERLKETDGLFSGLFWTGEEAVKLGLADRLGSAEQVAREVVGASRIVDYTIKDAWTDRLAKNLGAAMGRVTLQSLWGSPQLR